MRKLISALFAAGLLFGPGMAAAQQAIGSYVAWIGVEDLFNSNGQRLSEPWQILRQDRANYHRFNIRQHGDEWDPYFADAGNRADLEQLIRRGQIDRNAANALIRGNVLAIVTLYGTGNRIDSVNVTVRE